MADVTIPSRAGQCAAAQRVKDELDVPVITAAAATADDILNTAPRRAMSQPHEMKSGPRARLVRTME